MLCYTLFKIEVYNNTTELALLKESFNIIINPKYKENY